MGLVACTSPTPTAPSSAFPSDVAPHAETASPSSASVTTAGAELSAAKTIKITQGMLALQSLVPGTVALRGSHGFSFDGRIQSGLEPSAYCGPFDPCPPGASVPFTATWVGTDIPGIELTGSFVAPAHLTDTASVTVPLAANGLLSRGYPFPALQLIGSGEVTFRLEWQSAIGGWAIRFSSFDFGRGRPN